MTPFLSRLRSYCAQWPSTKERYGPYRYLINHAFPHCCLLCEEAIPRDDSPGQNGICSPCQDYLLRPRYACQCCGLPLISADLLCGQCLKKSPAFERTFSPFLYQKPLDSLIKQFKHQRQLRVGRVLAKIFANEVQQYYSHHHLSLPDYIVPTPLHWRRQWQRGFNQSMLVAGLIAEQIDIPVFKGCKKVVATHMQEQLNRQQRLKNLRGVFSLVSPTASASLEGKHCAIVDDVMTTGATANSLASTLRRAGAGTIHVWVLARTPK